MSVVAGKRSEGDLKVITVSGELCDYTLQITSAEKHFPKRYRWSITNRIVQTALDIDDHLIHANSVYVRSDDGSLLRRQTHQLVQLAVLDDMDHYIKEVLRIKGYVRYMDDFILIHEDKDHLKYCLGEITRMLSDLGLELNEKKTGIQPVKNGIHFLGFSFRLTDTGKVLQTILHKKISTERRKLRKLVDKVKAGEMTKQHVDECYQAWRSHVDKGNCQSVLSKMDSYYVNLYAE